MPSYQLSNIGVLNLDTGEDIPNAPDKRQWNTYLAWRAAGNAPQPGSPDAWLPASTADLTARTDAAQAVLTLMQADYLTAGDTASAAACRDLKAQFDALASDPALTGAASRQAFNTAARAKLRAIAASAPPAVLARLKRDPNFG